MAMIGPIVRNDYFFPVTMLALAALMVLLEYRRRKPDAGAPSQPAGAASANSNAPANKAEARKQEWTQRRERLWANLVVATAFIFIFMVTAEFIYAKGPELSEAIPVTFDSNGRVSIPDKDLAEGDLRRYSAEVNGVKVRFLLYRKPDGKVATIFDACEICGSVGFYKGNNGIVCKNCAAPINPQSVGQPGGCNPIPLQSTREGDAVVIKITDLMPELRQFSH
jgi:uncharacterized membrane protein